MAVEDWIDSVVDMWAGVAGHQGKTLHAYLVYRRAEIPDTPADFPFVLTFTQGLQPNYSAGGPQINAWVGVSEFHLFPDLSRAHDPEIMLYYQRVVAAMASHLTLGGKVSHFLPRADVAQPIRAPVRLEYGEEPPHLGLVVQWEVKEIVNGEYTVGG